MNQADQNRVSMWKAARKTLDIYSDDWKSSKPFSRYSDELTAVIADADKALEGQSATTTGITKDKAALGRTAVAKVVVIAGCAKSYALEHDNQTLFDSVNFAKNTLLHIPQNELPAKLRTILAAAQGVAKDLEEFDIAGTDFTGAGDAITAFEEASPEARAAIAGRAGITKSVPDIMNAGLMALTKMDNIIETFKEKSPAFVAAYKAARVVVDAGSRHKPAPADNK